MSKKNAVRNAVESIKKGDAVSLRKSIKEALHQKIRTALAKKEKEIAKTFLDDLENK